MTDYKVRAGEVEEDIVTSWIEGYTAQIPSSVYLIAAGVSVIGSLMMRNKRNKHNALFIGQWVAPFLLLGIYNKMVKQHGSDAASRGSSQAA